MDAIVGHDPAVQSTRILRRMRSATQSRTDGWSRRHLMASALATRFARVAQLRDLQARVARETDQLLHVDRRHVIALAGCTAVQWPARYAILWVVLAVFRHAVPFAVVLLAQAVVMHAAQWSGASAGAGAAEFGLAAALTPWLSPSSFAPPAIGWRLANLPLAVRSSGIALLRLMRNAPNTPTIVPPGAAAPSSA